MSRLAVVQTPPVFLDRKQTLAKAVASVREAAQGGARLVVFPEAFIPGYPAWIWRLRPGGDMALTEKLHSLLRANAVDLAGDDLSPLCEAARKEKVAVVCGVHERDADFGGGTLYNTVVVIGPDGTFLNRHRKLMPTNPERMVWGFGDASGLKTVATPCGRVGVMICWESYMPLARYALYAQGLEVYVAPTYDSGDRCVATMQHIAREGGCWVAGGGCAFRASDIPDDVPGKAELFPNPDEWVNPGDSVIVAPGGKIVAGPLHEEFGILYADIDLARVGMARRSLDVVGHYSRPDVFQLHVNRKPLRPVEFGTPGSVNPEAK
ncbi:MAG TPA: carbon-nitrogen hydrolase family protein [Burkholderiales bacterium]|nr:carbon-nitrogen hydrolase family protein [Burkholderiales bacterium]